MCVYIYIYMHMYYMDMHMRMHLSKLDICGSSLGHALAAALHAKGSRSFGKGQIGVTANVKLF